MSYDFTVMIILHKIILLYYHRLNFKNVCMTKCYEYIIYTNMYKCV